MLKYWGKNTLQLDSFSESSKISPYAISELHCKNGENKYPSVLTQSWTEEMYKIRYDLGLAIFFFIVHPFFFITILVSFCCSSLLHFFYYTFPFFFFLQASAENVPPSVLFGYYTVPRKLLTSVDLHKLGTYLTTDMYICMWAFLCMHFLNPSDLWKSLYLQAFL